MDDEDCGMEALFGTFMNEVTNIKTSKMKKIESQQGTPEEIIDRLKNMKYDPKQGQGSAYLVLMVTPEASESEITKAYRKLSVLIHPDKCSLEGASDAFQLLSQAYADTKDPNYCDKYKDVVAAARARVRKRRTKENEIRKKKGEDPLDMDGGDFDREVLKECDQATEENDETTTYKNEVFEANMKRMEEQCKQAKQSRKDETKEKKLFDKGRDKRAAGWQTFQANVNSKKFKTGMQTLGKAFEGVDVRYAKGRDVRPDNMPAPELDMTDKKVAKSVGQAGQMGIDRSYRDHWR